MFNMVNDRIALDIPGLYSNIFGHVPTPLADGNLLVANNGGPGNHVLRRVM